MRHPPKHARRLNNLTAKHPARVPNPNPTTINKQDRRYERGTNGGLVRSDALYRARHIASM
jgi:hypothetical protein